MKIDKDSAQLAEALAGEQARIIITTLQKFPFVLHKVGDLPERPYAVIVDEAHSSQTGEAAKDLRMSLGATDEKELTVAEAEDAGFIAQAVDPVEEALAKAVAARGRQPNLSFFAFTATPKARTLELFGTWHQETGRFEPFHLYSMRQAIEEGFILDVLANYTTYQTYWRIEKAVADDPAYEAPKARVPSPASSLSTLNLAQKAEIIVDTSAPHTASKIGGRGQGHGRHFLAAPRRALPAGHREYIAKMNYTDLATLVAFRARSSTSTV